MLNTCMLYKQYSVMKSFHLSLLADSGKNDSSSPQPHHTVKSNVSTKCLPRADELKNNRAAGRVLTAPQRHVACFLRTKSDGAISSSSVSSPLTSNKELLATRQALSGYLQNQNRMKTGQEVHDIKLKRRSHQPVQINSRQWPTLTQDTVMANSDCYEYDPSVDSVEFQCKVPKSSKNDNPDSCQKYPSSSALQSYDKSNDGFLPSSTIYWNGRISRSMKTGSANVVNMQNVSTLGKHNGNVSDIACCMAVPLSTSNIVNINHLCSATGQNNAAIHRRIIVIKRCHNLPPT